MRLQHARVEARPISRPPRGLRAPSSLPVHPSATNVSLVTRLELGKNGNAPWPPLAEPCRESEERPVVAPQANGAFGASGKSDILQREVLAALPATRGAQKRCGSPPSCSGHRHAQRQNVLKNRRVGRAPSFVNQRTQSTAGKSVKRANLDRELQLRRRVAVNDLVDGNTKLRFRVRLAPRPARQQRRRFLAAIGERERRPGPPKVERGPWLPGHFDRRGPAKPERENKSLYASSAGSFLF